MSNLDIKISFTKMSQNIRRWYGIMDKGASTLIIKSFAGYIRRLYLRLLGEAMSSHRYKGQWEPVDDAGYKEYIGVAPVGDMLSLIRDALEIQKIGYNFVVRFDPRYKYPGSSHLLSTVVRSIDRGTSKFSARPIFSRVQRDIKSNMDDLFRSYLKMMGVI